MRHRREQQTGKVTDVHRRCGGRAPEAGDTRPRQHRPAVRFEQDVGEIEPTVHDTGGMRRGQRLGERQPDRHHLTGVEALPDPEQPGQVDRPVDRLRHDGNTLGRRDHVDDRNKMWMAELDQQPRRPHRGLTTGRVRRQPDPPERALGPGGHDAAGPHVPGAGVPDPGAQHDSGYGRIDRVLTSTTRTGGIVH